MGFADGTFSKATPDPQPLEGQARASQRFILPTAAQSEDLSRFFFATAEPAPSHPSDPRPTTNLNSAV